MLSPGPAIRGWANTAPACSRPATHASARSSTSSIDEAFAVESDAVPIDAAVDARARRSTGLPRVRSAYALSVHQSGQGRTDFPQHVQAGRVIDLPVDENDRRDGAIADRAPGLQDGIGLQLRRDVRRGVDQRPGALAAAGDGDRGLRSRPRTQRALRASRRNCCSCSSTAESRRRRRIPALGFS